MPTVKINGIEVEVPEGTNMIEAAAMVGEEIPHYCYHKDLTVAGNCRMCLIDVEEGGRGPDIACNMQARDGLAIRTDTEQVVQMRKSVMEFLLKNHPLDCPICDQSGECRLQDYYMKHGQHDSRLADPKVSKAKRVDIGEHIMLDAERCVACTRCVRFGDEITGTGELRLFQRTDHTEIGIFPGETLSHEYQGNLADICPVGALTNKDFRFEKRVWYLKESASVCDGCATGCNINVCHQQNEVFRYMPRRNPEVNASWICDAGRMTYRKQAAASRILAPRVDGRRAAWDDATAAATERLADKKIGVVLGTTATLEENHAAAELARQRYAGARLFVLEGNDPDALTGSDEFLIHEDKSLNRRGAALVAGDAAGDGAALSAALASGEINALVVIRDDALARMGADAPDTLVFLGAQANTTSRAAHVVLPLAALVEQAGAAVNAGSRVQRMSRGPLPTGDSLPGHEGIDRLAQAAGGSVASGTASAVFEEMASKYSGLQGMTYGALGDLGLPLAVGRAAPAPEAPVSSPVGK